MDRERLPKNSDLFLDGGFWKLRWTQPDRGDHDSSPDRQTEPARIGPATGPDGLTESEALRIVWKNLLTELQQSLQAEHSRMTVAQFVERKFVPEHVARKGLSGQTHYQSMLKHVLTPEEVDHIFHTGAGSSRKKLKAIPDWPYLSKLKLCDARPDHVHRITAAALEKGYSSQTVAHIRNVISAIFSHAKHERCFAGENPVTAVRLSKVTRSDIRTLSFAQAQDALAIMKYPEREMMLMTVFTGMNMSEICGLQWKHVNLADEEAQLGADTIPPRSIAVRMQWYRGALESVKSCRARTVPIPRPLLQTLIQLKSRERFTGPDDFVLVSRVGTAINQTNIVARRLRPIGRQLGVSSLSWHVFRRTRKVLASEFGNQFQDSMARMLRAVSNPASAPPSQWRCRSRHRNPLHS